MMVVVVVCNVTIETQAKDPLVPDPELDNLDEMKVSVKASRW